MALFSRSRDIVVQRQPYRIEVHGVSTDFAGDWYHLMIRAPWWLSVLMISGGFLFVNLFFALAYVGTGGIVGARADSFADLFFFSVQTMATVGYGSMYPATTIAHVLSTGESVVGI